MHSRIPGQKFPECPSLDAICLQSILGSGHRPHPLQAPRPKPLMPLTAKPTFTQASSPDESPSSVLSSSRWLCLPTPFLGSPWRVTAPQHPQASEGRSVSALPTSRPCPGCRAYWRQEAQEEAREETAVPAGYLSAIHFIPRLPATEGACLWRSEAGYSSVPRGLLFVSLWSCTVAGSCYQLPLC